MTREQSRPGWPAGRIGGYAGPVSVIRAGSDRATQFAGLRALQALAVAQPLEAVLPPHTVLRDGGSAGWLSRAWAHRFRLVIFAVNGMNVFAAGLLIQVLLVKYAGLSHVASYIVQTVVSVQLSFLLSRYLTWRDRTVAVGGAFARFNARQLTVTGLGMAGYAGLDRLGMNYIAANIAVTALLTPVSFLSSHMWSLSRPDQEEWAAPERPARRLRRARQLTIVAAGGLAIAGGVYALGPYSVPVVLLLANSFNLAVASLETRWRFYALRNPEAIEQLAWPEPIRPGHERISFSSIVCALDEAAAIGATLEGMIKQTHRRHQIIVSLRDHDLSTIAAVRTFARANPGTIEVVVGHYDAAGKHAQLNGALPHCTGDYIGPIDSEDDVAPELLVHVESLIRRTNADIVQGAVQLMNLGRTWQEWYKVHNVEEYRAWYSSRMAFQVSAGFVPLGGNTVYTRASLLREAGGWPASPTEDCAAGVLMCTQYGAKVVAAYSPALATREEVPGAVFNKETGSLFWQRVRWLQGIFQELVQGTWLQMPTLRQKLLAGYILATPILQALSCGLIPLAIFTALVLKMPIALVMFMFTPLIPMALTIVSMLAGVRAFGHDYAQQVRLRHYASILFLTPIYQVILAMAAVVAVAKYLRGDKGWYKTGRLNQHRTQATAAETGPLRAAA
jgi:cellulose synthase/poly-beta-1,6-N-acetylglucosamine synthase-like glycosyltransferase/putative flippase GtrA